MNIRLASLAFLSLFLVVSCAEDQGSASSNPTSGFFGSEPEVPEVTALTDEDAIEELISNAEFQGKLHRRQQLSDFYSTRDFQPVWVVPELREELFRNIEEIEYEGLFFEDYHGKELKSLLQKVVENSKDENTRLEILLTDSYLRLTEDLARGKLNPKEIYKIWGTPLNGINTKDLLQKAIAEKKLQQSIDSVKPDNIVYNGLKKALKNFKRSGIEEDSISKIELGKLIRPGDKDERVWLIAKRLLELGYLENYSDTTSTIYSKQIQVAVQSFQKDHGLLTDALIGDSTIKDLNLSRRDRYHQILVNLERWRWYPRELGDHYIIANIPAYELSLVKNGDTLRRHKTMVGTEARKTPVFSDEIQYIVYNPTWTIPPTIKKNDVIPGITKDPNYLQKKNLQVLDGKNNKVDPSGIDWSSPSARNYIFRQQAGPTNPLGLVKIIYPNEYMIYLHDTPSKELFNKNARAQSSGCVRVQNVLDLASYLLNDQPKYDDKRINEIIKSGKTTEIRVTQKVKVHHFYWTAFSAGDSLKFIHDIYNLDKPLWEKLKPAS